MIAKQHSTIDDSATLAATLAASGVRHLRTATAAPPLLLEPAILIAALSKHKEPRLRESLIPLFLRHPTYAQHVPQLSNTLSPIASMTLRHMYTAAVYLQRLWRGTLGIYLGDFPLLPEYFGQQEFGLPHPNDHFGEAGLRTLASLFQQKTGYNWLSTYDSAISLFLAQLRLEYTNDNSNHLSNTE